MGTWKFWGALALFLLFSAVLAGAVAPAANAGLRDAAAVIAFAGLVAVGIERVIEGFWALVDRSKKLGGYWPLSEIVSYLDEVETQANSLAGGVLESAKAALETARDAADAGSQEARRASEMIERLNTEQLRLQKQLTEAQKLAPGSARLTAFANVATDASREAALAAKIAGDAAAGVRSTLNNASAAASAGLSIIASFQANPARRLSSLLVGASFGMLVAGLMGLNLFAAVLAPPAGEPEPLGILMGSIGVVLTGFVVGLGVGPTHELVKTLENIKESRNQTIVAGPGGGPSVTAPTVNVLTVAGTAAETRGGLADDLIGAFAERVGMRGLEDRPERGATVVTTVSEAMAPDPLLTPRTYVIRSTG
jgi:hypothetical protein